MKVGFLSIMLLLWALARPFEKARAKGVVCIYDSTDIFIKGNLTAVVEVHRSFEITSEPGLRYTEVTIPVNNYVEVRDIKGFSELPGGVRKSLTKQEIGTSSLPAFQGFGDNQIITFTLRMPNIGSKFYYEYKLIAKSLLYLSRFTRHGDYPVDRLALSLRWDKKVSPLYDVSGLNVRTYDRRLHFWAQNLPEIPGDPQSCADPLHLSISADIFSYNKVKYLSRSWPEVGRFFALLSRQPANMGEDVKSLARRLCSNCRTGEDTLQAFFSFLADSISYVALEVGKGDFSPHSCPVIINRRFGDCKDQSVLLSSLYRVVGLDAYPALISTTDYPPTADLHPWPSWFDHVITVIKAKDHDILLDPSDPLASVNSLPPRLRGKNYLICDGFSGLKRAPLGVSPASSISSQFSISRLSGDGLAVEFRTGYANDAAGIYKALWKGKRRDEVLSSLQADMRHSKWHFSTLEIEPIQFLRDSVIVTGRFLIKAGDIASGNLSIPSPLNAYLLDNIFPDVRRSDYCDRNSIRLEEKIAIDLGSSQLAAGPEFSDLWTREGLSFLDELTLDGQIATFHRLFDFTGGELGVTDYNAFRDFLLSRADQQYVRIEK